MIKTLANIISHFPGAANRVRCTAHIVNLVSKIILRQFDTKKKTNGHEKKSEDANNEANDENANDKVNNDDNANVDELEVEEDLNSLAGDLDREEQEVADDEDGDMSGNIVADLEEIEETMKEEVLEVAKKVKPIKRVLFKVRTWSNLAFYIVNVSFCYQLRKLAYAIKRSTTILLPRWNDILQELATTAATTDKKPLPVRIMPRDVSTRWNSTYEMLKFAYTYREAIDKITGDRAMKLRDYELLESEWETVKQLRDSLKVRNNNYFHYYITDLAI